LCFFGEGGGIVIFIDLFFSEDGKDISPGHENSEW
jgi:hypothetical protein